MQTAVAHSLNHDDLETLEKLAVFALNVGHDDWEEIHSLLTKLRKQTVPRPVQEGNVVALTADCDQYVPIPKDEQANVETTNKQISREQAEAMWLLSRDHLEYLEQPDGPEEDYQVRYEETFPNRGLSYADLIAQIETKIASALGF